MKRVAVLMVTIGFGLIILHENLFFYESEILEQDEVQIFCHFRPIILVLGITL